jgi:SpoIIAA-like
MPGDDGFVYFDRPGVATVVWEPRHRTVLVEWSGSADADEFFALLDAEVKALQEHEGLRILADCRRQGVLDPEAQDLADRDWLPRALAAGLRRFAVVLPTSRIAAINLEDRLSRLPGEKLEIRYFATVDEARRWLSEPFE